MSHNQIIELNLASSEINFEDFMQKSSIINKKYRSEEHSSPKLIEKNSHEYYKQYIKYSNDKKNIIVKMNENGHNPEIL